MKVQERIAKQRWRRRNHVRNRIRESGRLRLSVFRSNRHISAQIIDDEAGRTLVSASTMEKTLGGVGKAHGTVDDAKSIGKVVAERALAAGIKEVAFDRGDNSYHGRVAALADAAREAGLDF
ncbi:50S ribosomal protein L18 [Planctomicrobium sp. SH668]|uniref:50S ribosomal protein L18 n=1 Tax=Planctomicrobium sp. SH668 TaxID=3448126 RepID=UPI003F5BC9E7